MCCNIIVVGSSNSGGTLRAINRPPNRPIPLPGRPALKPDLGPPVIFRSVTRPPLAGPYAFSRIPTPVWNRPRVFLLHDIADTWLFANFSSGYAFTPCLSFFSCPSSFLSNVCLCCFFSLSFAYLFIFSLLYLFCFILECYVCLFCTTDFVIYFKQQCVYMLICVYVD